MKDMLSQPSQNGRAMITNTLCPYEHEESELKNQFTVHKYNKTLEIANYRERQFLLPYYFALHEATRHEAVWWNKVTHLINPTAKGQRRQVLFKGPSL